MVEIKQFYIYFADLDPKFGTEPGKIRPVVVIQTDLLNDSHVSTITCPITSKIELKTRLLRVHLPKKSTGLKKDSDILVDQVRAIDNRRFISKVGKLTEEQIEKLKRNLSIILFE